MVDFCFGIVGFAVLGLVIWLLVWGVVCLCVTLLGLVGCFTVMLFPCCLRWVELSWVAY